MVSGQRLPGPRGQQDAPLQTGAVHSRHLVLACPDPSTFLLSVSLMDLIYLPNLLGFFLGLISSFFPTYLLLAVLGFCCCSNFLWLQQVEATLVAVCRLLVAVGSLVAVHGL